MSESNLKRSHSGLHKLKHKKNLTADTLLRQRQVFANAKMEPCLQSSTDHLKGIIHLTPDYSSGSYLLMQRAIPPQPRGGCYAG